MTRQIRSFLTATLSLAALALATPALAGPPLLCHPYDIGSASSLPWDGAAGWDHGRADYDLTRLVADTQALLTPSTPVIVRMETLRRAALYASRDAQVAKQLFETLVGRADAARTGGRPDALALLDAAYVTGAFREIGMLDRDFAARAAVARSTVGKTDGYALISLALVARPSDPALQFAAALIAADQSRSRYAEHAVRARAGAAADPLLARNLDHVQ